MKTYKAPNNSLHAIEPEFAYMLPAGCVEITDEEAAEIRAASVQETTKPTQQELIASAMLHMKSNRMDVFRVLDTLQVDALTAGNSARALAIMQAKSAMTDLNYIDLSSCQTMEEMEAVIQFAYWGIVSQSPQEVQDAFNALVPR